MPNPRLHDLARTARRVQAWLLCACAFQAAPALAEAACLAPGSVQQAEVTRQSLSPRVQLDAAEARLTTLAANDVQGLACLVAAADAARALGLHRRTIDLAKQGLAIEGGGEAERHDLLMILANAYDNNGQGELGLAIVNEQMARLARTSNDSQLRDVLYQRGVLQTTAGSYNAALSDLRRALNLPQAPGARIQRSDILVALSVVYQEFPTTQKKAEEWLRMAMAEIGESRPSTRLSEAQYRYAFYLSNENRLEEAVRWFTKSAETGKALQDELAVAFANYGIGRIRFRQQHFQESQQLLEEARPYFVAAEDRLTVGYLDRKLAEIAFELKDNRTALDRVNRLMDMAVEMTNDPLKLSVLRLRAKIRKAMGQANEAYTDLDASYDIFEEVSLVERDQKIAQLEAQFELEKQAKDNLILKQKARLDAALISNQQKKLAMYVTIFAAVIFAVLLLLWHRQRQHRLLKQLSETDTLTRLPNRRCLMQFNEREVSRSQRHRLPYTLAILDLDYFKKINDTYGHPAGDQVLSEFARTASATLRGDDMLARLGGEEFVLCMPHTDEARAMVTLDRIRENMAEMALPLLGNAPPPTFSAGLARLAPDEQSGEALLARADQALYRAKENGRNRTELAALPASAAAA